MSRLLLVGCLGSFLTVIVTGCQSAPVPALTPCSVAMEEPGHPLEDRLREVAPVAVEALEQLVFGRHLVPTAFGDVVGADPVRGTDAVSVRFLAPDPQIQCRLDGVGSVQLYCDEVPGARTSRRAESSFSF